MRFLLFLLAAGLGAQSLPQWRLSDALGSDLGPAPLAKPASTHWTLRIETRGNAEEQVRCSRTAPRNGRGSSTGTPPDGRCVSAICATASRCGTSLITPKPAFRPPKTTFNAGQPVEVATLTFEDRVLTVRVVKDPEGVPLYTDRLYRWPDGTLRRVERDGPTGPMAEAAWLYSGGKLTGAWASSEDEKAKGRHREWTFAAGATNEVLATETQTLLTRVSEAGDAGKKETLTDAAGRVETRTTDDHGRLTGEMVTVKDALVEVRRWTYDSEGRVTEASTESAGPPETWAYMYNADGTVLSRLSRAGVLVKGGARARRRTGHGEPVPAAAACFLVQETWNEGRRVKETYYQNGVIVRERKP